jgi:hypothetical protein
MGLPATGGVRSILGTESEIWKTVDLDWSYAGLSNICDASHTGAPPYGQTCVAEEVYRNSSFGADLGWFTLNGDCEGPDNKGFQGLCFMLANDKIAPADDGITSTLLASADSRRSSSCPVLSALWNTVG